PPGIHPHGRGEAAARQLPGQDRRRPVSGDRPGEDDLVRLIRGLVRRHAPGLLTGVGDDCAVLETRDGAALLATTDLLVEDVHFRRRWAEPADIGAKAMAVNVSDIAAMGGTPRWALVGLGCPEGTAADEIEAFYEGALAVADAHGLAIDLGRLVAESGAGARVDVERLPIAAATRAVAEALDADPVDWATGGGEDYELLVVCEPTAFARLRDGLPEATGTLLTAVGEV